MNAPGLGRRRHRLQQARHPRHRVRRPHRRHRPRHLRRRHVRHLPQHPGARDRRARGRRHDRRPLDAAGRGRARDRRPRQRTRSTSPATSTATSSRTTSTARAGRSTTTCMTTDQLYQDLVIAGVSLSVAQGSQGAVIVTENAGGTIVSEENGGGPIGTVDNYNVRLGAGADLNGLRDDHRRARHPARTASATTDLAGGDSILLTTGSTPTGGLHDHGDVRTSTSTRSYDDRLEAICRSASSSSSSRRRNWRSRSRSGVGAVNDALHDGTRVYEISHSVLSADPFFDNAVVRNVEVTKIDTGTPAILVSELGNTPVAQRDPAGRLHRRRRHGGTTFTSATRDLHAERPRPADRRTDGGAHPGRHRDHRRQQRDRVTLSNTVAAGSGLDVRPAEPAGRGSRASATASSPAARPSPR